MNSVNAIKRQKLLDFAKELTDKGYEVYAPAEVTTYCNFVLDDQIGYVEAGDYGFNFGTVHKPSRKIGTGFSVHRDVATPTVGMAKDCLVVAPIWVFMSDRREVNKYKDWADYASSPLNSISPKELIKCLT